MKENIFVKKNWFVYISNKKCLKIYSKILFFIYFYFYKKGLPLFNIKFVIFIITTIPETIGLAIFRVYIGHKAKNIEEIFSNPNEPYTKYIFICIVVLSVGIVCYITYFTKKLLRKFDVEDIHDSI